MEAQAWVVGREALEVLEALAAGSEAGGQVVMGMVAFLVGMQAVVLVVPAGMAGMVEIADTWVRKAEVEPTEVLVDTAVRAVAMAAVVVVVVVAVAEERDTVRGVEKVVADSEVVLKAELVVVVKAERRRPSFLRC